MTGGKTNAPDIDEALAAALSNYMMAAYRRRPTQSEMWDIYWDTVTAIEEVVRGEYDD